MTRTSDRVFANKLKRLARGEPIRTLDLFAGCGGLSLGFQAAGFEIVGAVEFDAHAAQTHAWNFCHGVDDDEMAIHATPRDIRQTEPVRLVQELHLGESVADAIDVLIGGPPCQAFARVGRAKLREVDAHPKAFLKDARGNLYLRYLQYVRELKPVALLMENVPDAMNYGGHNIAEEFCEVLADLGYTCAYTMLNAAFYGVPQMRERMYLLAYRRELGAIVQFPQPTNWVDLPVGYEGSRAVALKSLRNRFAAADRAFSFDEVYYELPPAASRVLPAAVSAHEAIGDLPPITLHLEGRMKKAPQRFTEIISYGRAGRMSAYARLMRTWPDFEAPDGLRDHVTRCLPRDYQIFRQMNPGDQYPQAYQHALDLFAKRLAQLQRRGEALRKGTKSYDLLWKSIVPPYDPSKFPNKWRKMEQDCPSRTLLAHIGKDTYSHIHYDSEQARTISVREAARLQSFPDGFRFAGTMNPAFRQIGNAVPPLMAKAIAKQVVLILRGEMRRANRSRRNGLAGRAVAI